MKRKKHCTCTLKDVLVGEDVQFIIEHLFKKVGDKAPQGEMLGFIDDSKRKGDSGCPFFYSFGCAYYCDNQSLIKQYIEEHKDRFPELRERGDV